jgi:tetratricopeptide (TPR) repeat protein
MMITLFATILTLSGLTAYPASSNANPNELSQLFLQHRFDEALQVLEVVPASERDLSYYLMVSQASTALQQYDNAITALQLARGIDSNNMAILYQLARTYNQAGQSSIAKSHLTSVLRVEPSHTQSLLLLGSISAEERDWVTATRVYQQLVAHDSSNAQFRYNLGQVYMMTNNHGPSLQELFKAHELSPNHLGILHDLIRIYFIMGQFDRAAEFADNAVKRFPTHIPFRRRYGEIEFRRTNYKEAGIQYKEAIDLGENTANMWRNYGMCYYFSENYEMAIEALLQSIAIEGGDPNAQFYLAMAYARVGSPDTALPHLDMAIQNSMGTLLVDGLIQKGVIYSDKKDVTNAASSYMLAYQLTPSRSEILFHTAAAYDKAGNHRSVARDFYRRFLDAAGDKDPTMTNYAQQRVTRLTEEIHFRGE